MRILRGFTGPGSTATFSSSASRISTSRPSRLQLIRTHPETETGRKSLYFDPGKILFIEGLEQAESEALIDELAERMIQPEAEYRHQWEKGDIVIQDNRCSYHKAAGDCPPAEDRIHWRVSIKDFPALAGWRRSSGDVHCGRAFRCGLRRRHPT